MSIVHMPNVRMYWSENIGYSRVQEAMLMRRFEQLQQPLHFSGNSKMLPYEHEDSDRLYEIRPLIEKLNNNFERVPLGAHLSVDEQCSTNARSVLKQYLPDKPHKWGFKLFVVWVHHKRQRRNFMQIYTKIRMKRPSEVENLIH